MKRLVFAVYSVLFFLACAPSVLAQSTINAASCNQSDVQTAVNNAADGDTINIPAGSCSWTQGVTVNVGLSIIGAGAGSTTITDNYTGGQLFTWNIPSATSSLSRLSSLTINPGNSGSYAQPTLAWIRGTCNSSTCSNVRWDHITSGTWNYGTNFQGFLIYSDNVFGVIDHNTINFSSGGEFWNVGHSSYGGVGTNGDNSWAQPDSYGTANALYFETNTFSTTATGGMAITDSDVGGGARLVGRFNILTNASFQTHGTESTGRTRSARQVEVYNNNVTANGISGLSLIGLRGGTALSFDNTFTVTGGGWVNNEVSPTLYRAGASFNPWGYCDGQGQWDENAGTVLTSGSITSTSLSGSTLTVGSITSQSATSGSPYSVVDVSISDANGFHPGTEITSNSNNTVTSTLYWAWDGGADAVAFNNGNTYQVLQAAACIDQPGRGGNGATYISGTTPSPTGWVNEPLDPIYEWGSTESGGTPNFGWVFPNATTRLLNNRDFYQQISSFNGASGTGTGTLANRPSSCTTGVGYWATDQGNWNSSGSGGQGEFYVCTATNTWSLDYTPYTYPHPLTGTGTGTSLPPPTSLVAVPH